MKIILSLNVVLITLLFSCAPLKKKGDIVRAVKTLEHDYQHHSGLVVYDPSNGEYLLDYQGDKYFTPASNTKIITLLSSLTLLGDTLPGIHYVQQGDSLIFWGTGDPSFLNKALPDSKVYQFLKNAPGRLFFSSSNYNDNHFGAGWAWDDYLYTFSSEKSPMPIYGNNLAVSKSSSDDFLTIKQPYFKRFFWLGDSTKSEDPIYREFNSNNIYYYPSEKSKQFEEDIPFRYSDHLLVDLLADTLNRSVDLINWPLPANYKTLYSISADSVYKEMMQESDNFIAEQLILMIAGKATGQLNTKGGIAYAEKKVLAGIPDQAVWVDGSGLSRYNLITPRSLVWIWDQLYKKIPEDRLMSLISVGGQSGTLKKYYKSDSPYIFGKTGTLSNNHNLSGFLKTQKGKVYIFAFTNNNYPVKATVIKKEMEQILLMIHQNN